MKSKAPLALMEQLVMLVVFALAAALCVQAFVLAQRLSEQSHRKEQAALAVQNAAETLKSCAGDYALAAQTMGGTWNGAQWEISYDADWQIVEPGEGRAAYVRVTPQPGDTPLLGTAKVCACTAADEPLFAVEAAWQEVKRGG